MSGSPCRVSFPAAEQSLQTLHQLRVAPRLVYEMRYGRIPEVSHDPAYGDLGSVAHRGLVFVSPTLLTPPEDSLLSESGHHRHHGRICESRATTSIEPLEDLPDRYRSLGGPKYTHDLGLEWAENFL